MSGLKAAASAALAIGLGMGAAHAQGSGSATLDAMKSRGLLVCGVSTGVAGFSLADSQGVIKGIDADDCRAVAAAVLGDANKVRFVPTTTINRFTALQSGEIDVLIRETTWTLGREGSLGLEFADVNYYDGTGFLVKTAANVKSVKELGRRHRLRAARHQHRTRDQRLFPRQQHQVHAGRDPGHQRDPERVHLRPLRRLFHRQLGAGRLPLPAGGTRQRI